MKKTLNISFFIGLIAILFFSCQKEKFYTNGNASLRFSMDTVAFDTLFSTIGSTTLNFTVHNPYSDDLKINSISLVGQESSNFRINIDGAPVLSTTDKLLRGKDSMYIFVDVNIDPQDKNLPFVVEDRIVFNTNGKEQHVLLQAYGQDAHHMKLGEWGSMSYKIDSIGDSTFFITLDKDTTLKADKPYYLHDNFLVNKNTTLTLAPGVRFFIKKNKNIDIAGSLKSLGTVDAPVVFRGDRLDNLFTDTPYDKVPGQWGAISFEQLSYNNELRHTHIRNGLIGIIVDSLSVNRGAKVMLANCRIENMTSAAIWGINAEIRAENCVFANCAQNILKATAGGRYDFTHCTFANHYTWDRNIEGSIVLTNFRNDRGESQPYALERANFTNCIIDGQARCELSFDSLENEAAISAAFNYSFDHCLVRIDDKQIDTTDANFRNTIWNKNPFYTKDPGFFEPEDEWDFRIDTLSPAIDTGKATYLSADINEMPHIDAPDLGAFEFSGGKEEE